MSTKRATNKELEEAMKRRKEDKKAQAQTKRKAHVEAYEKTYKGSTHRLEVVERGGRRVYRLDGGDEFASLTGAANAIADYVANGPRFWGVRRRGKRHVRGRSGSTHQPNAAKR